MRLAFDVVEEDRSSAGQMLLPPRDLEVGIDRLIGLDQVALPAQPLERAAQIRRMVLLAGRGPFLAQCFLHGSWAPHVRRRMPRLPQLSKTSRTLVMHSRRSAREHQGLRLCAFQ